LGKCLDLEYPREDGIPREVARQERLVASDPVHGGDVTLASGCQRPDRVDETERWAMRE